ncbi:MAG: metallopeptidase TldD-related protein [Alphaproteobacteria bacterium]
MTQPDILNLLQDLVDAARAAGADAADAVAADGASVSHGWRLGKTERLERSEEADLGLRVFVGRRQAIASTTDRSPRALRDLADRAVAMARAVPEDPHAGLADPDQIARAIPQPDMADPVEPAPETLIARAQAAEEAALAVAGVTNSEGAEASWSRSDIAIVASNGFAGHYGRTYHALSVSVLAGTGTAMERDYDHSVAVHAEDLDDPVALGRNAGERAVRRLDPRKIKSCQVPVVYDPRISGGLLGHLAGAISGAAIARGTSFLKDMLGKPLFADGVSVVEDPLRPRGLATKPFDGEGLPTRRKTVIDGGTLTTWLLDLRSARQLGLKSTGNAARGASSPPSPSASNLWMEAGPTGRDAMIGAIGQGLYVTELIGMGVNGVTGDYSRGAAGFWIENGELTHPVSEVTVAGNLKTMFRQLTPADDLEFRRTINAPTVRIDGMTIAGN